MPNSPQQPTAFSPASAQLLGVILVDHGSRFSAANDMLDEVAAMFQRVSGRQIVQPAHMELAEPTIAQAFDACVRQGATRVVVHPYFLSPGKHSTTDIPRMVEQAAARHPGIAFHVTAPLGLDDKIAEVIMHRIAECHQNQYDCAYCQGRTHAMQERIRECAANNYTCSSCKGECPNRGAKACSAAAI